MIEGIATSQLSGALDSTDGIIDAKSYYSLLRESVSNSSAPSLKLVLNFTESTGERDLSAALHTDDVVSGTQEVDFADLFEVDQRGPAGAEKVERVEFTLQLGALSRSSANF